jgi:hypothetical protein
VSSFLVLPERDRRRSGTFRLESIALGDHYTSTHPFEKLLPLPWNLLCPKSNGHALRFVGTGNLELFEPFVLSSVAIPPNTSVGYAAIFIDRDARDSCWDIV